MKADRFAAPFLTQPDGPDLVVEVVPRSRGKGRQAIALAFIAVALSACGNIEPWVKPYERQALADPIMALDPHPISTAYTHHVFEAREGARGALGSAGGGCGCN